MGTNVADKCHNIDRAIEAIGSLGTIVAVSSKYETVPWGFESDNAFINIAMIIDTELNANELLDATQEIERQLGRTRKSSGGKYADRTIDIDIIDYGGLIMNTPRLMLPHPYTHLRKFVLIPLAEIAPQWQHPISYKSIDRLIADCSDRDTPRKL